jgi:hypothetical protein
LLSYLGDPRSSLRLLSARLYSFRRFETLERTYRLFADQNCTTVLANKYSPIEIPAARLKPKVLVIVFSKLQYHSCRLRDSKEVKCERSLPQYHGFLIGLEGPSSRGF